MTNNIIQTASVIFLLSVIFLEAYAVFYITETRKAARQLSIVIPGYIKILITATVVSPLLGLIIILLFFISSFFYK